jgi:hypothetical protein
MHRVSDSFLAFYSIYSKHWIIDCEVERPCDEIALQPTSDVTTLISGHILKEREQRTSNGLRCSSGRTKLRPLSWVLRKLDN